MSRPRAATYLGRLCKHGHSHEGSALSLRYQSSQGCIVCSAQASNRKAGATGNTYVGRLCKRGHEDGVTGGSLRCTSNGECMACHADRARKVDLVTRRGYVRRYMASERGRKTRAVYLDKNRERVRLWVQAGGRKRRARLAVVEHVPYNRADIAALRLRFKGQCAYCGAVATALDHVVPIVRGGDDALHNLVPACKRCNSSKGASVVDEWYPFQPFFDLERLKRIGQQYLETGQFLMSRKA